MVIEVRFWIKGVAGVFKTVTGDVGTEAADPRGGTVEVRFFYRFC